MNHRIKHSQMHAFLTESNRIEGVTAPPTESQVGWAMKFVHDWLAPDTERLMEAVSVFQPGARLRDQPGLNVRVGPHWPPRGGPKIRESLDALLRDVRAESRDPWLTHVEYETLHPFTDGNGRSGRLLWLWQMLQSGRVVVGYERSNRLALTLEPPDRS